MGLEEWYFGYLKNAFIPRYLLTLYRVHRVYHISFYSHFVQNKQSFITKKYSLYIVGEVRGEEALDMLQAMNTGHLVRASYRQNFLCLIMIIKSITRIGLHAVQVAL